MTVTVEDNLARMEGYARRVLKSLGKDFAGCYLTLLAMTEEEKPPFDPRLRDLQLCGESEEQALVAEAPRDLDPDRQPAGRPMKRQRDGRLTGKVEDRCEGRVLDDRREGPFDVGLAAIETAER